MVVFVCNSSSCLSCTLVCILRSLYLNEVDTSYSGYGNGGMVTEVPYKDQHIKCA